MGVKHLNNLIKTYCKSSLKKINLNEMANKKIAVDTSIYMYKYKQQGDLIDGMFSMINVFKKYNIQPIFIFDGKPPIEKQEVILQRIKYKEFAENKFNKLSVEFENLLNNNNKNNINIDKLEKEIDYYKRSMIKISYKDVIDVKNLIKFMGEDYYESYTEADCIIAKLAKEKKVWGCLSEDMDMFVYGCPIVLRYFSLIKEEVVVYDLNKILKNLNLTHDEFKEVCILSGSDYNVKLEYNINYILKKYNEYTNISSKDKSFYEWFKNKNCLLDINKLNKILLMFELNNIDLNKANFVEGKKDHKKTVELLIKYGYIFI
jgi:flap endonuclease-1